MMRVGEPGKCKGGRPWILVAAYDVSTGASPEGYVAFRVLEQLRSTHRIVLITRANNAHKLRVDQRFTNTSTGIYVVGFDLPAWARWWKRGARFYRAYAWLWQVCWPVALHRRQVMRHRLSLVHVLNFHNDSFPSLAWCLGVPAVWGPINHNEQWPKWRMDHVPSVLRVRMRFAFAIRRAMWCCDPFLRIWVRRSDVILSAGPWVDRRLGIGTRANVIHRSQLGVDPRDFRICPRKRASGDAGYRLVCAGRLDWIKGVDLALEALAQLPPSFRLRLVGSGPAESTLRTLAASLDVNDRVTFSAPIPRDQLALLYAEADAFLFPSAEVAGLAWVEALGCGLPVVGFAGQTELSMAARELEGIYLAGDFGSRHARIGAYADEIKRAVSDGNERLAVRQRLLKRYSWSALADVIRRGYAAAKRGELIEK